jgi:4-diphosphocytidyl-2-C-methyl-D-erythritol kinase
MSSRALSFLAPAKLNLFLHITGRRPDGYHELQTLFQLLDYGDRLNLELTTDKTLSLHSSSPQLLLDNNLPLDNNLIIKAARALRSASGQTDAGVKITLEKRIPMGAGLGGGSADAAITLIALNRLWHIGFSDLQLSEIGLQLGADIPLFIGARSAWAEGIGEILTPVDLPTSWYLVITPNCSISTAEIFSHEQLTRDSPAIKMADFLAGRAHNDCENITKQLYPPVNEALQWLSAHGKARMTGTGSSIFASFEDEASARAVLAKLPAAMPEKFKGFVAKGVNSLEYEYNAT